MQKIVGSIFVIVAGTCIGFVKGNEITERVRHMREVKRIFHALQQEIEYTRVPLGQAFARVAERCVGSFQDWLYAMWQLLSRREGGTIEKIWDSCTKKHLKPSNLSKEDVDVIARQGAYMGQFDVQMQSAAISLFMEQWEERILHATEQLESKRRLARCMGVLGGIFLVILLF